MSEANKKTFEDFLKAFDSKHKYLISVMATEYNRILGTNLSPVQFLELPEFQKIIQNRYN